MPGPILSYLIPTIIYLAFTVTHSLFASARFKEKLFSIAPSLKPYYRLLYNLFAFFLLLIWISSLPDDQTFYRIEGFFFYLMITVQILSGVCFLHALLTQNGSVFLGLKQLTNHLCHNKKPGYLDEPQRGELVKKGFYRYMRHPTYTFAMIFLLASPVMTANFAYLILMIGIYFGIGSVYEERNLEKRFGKKYQTYRQEVPRFIPDIFDIFRSKLS
jgi:methanethiol S-methyltransferase